MTSEVEDAVNAYGSAYRRWQYGQAQRPAQGDGGELARCQRVLLALARGERPAARDEYPEQFRTAEGARP